jgi:hypothetical protein
VKTTYKIFACLSVAATLFAPSTAQAVQQLTSYQGSDYSKNSSSGLTVSACDGENDGNDVSADYQRAGSSSEYHVVNGGGSGTCVYAGLSSIVYRHRAVELVPFTPDNYGPWVYPK